MLKALTVLAVSTLTPPIIASDLVETVVVGQEQVLESESGTQTLRFLGTSSAGVERAVGIACIPEERNSAGRDEISFTVSKSLYQIGASRDMALPLEDCLKYLANVREGRYEVALSWDQEKFDGFAGADLWVDVREASE